MVMSTPPVQITPPPTPEGTTANQVCVTAPYLLLNGAPNHCRQTYGMGRMLHSDARQVDHAPFENGSKGLTTDVTIFSPAARVSDTVAGGLSGKLRPTGLSAAENVPQLESNQ